MEFKEQITYIIENFDFDVIIAYLRIREEALGGQIDAESLKKIAKGMLEDIVENGGHRESHSMVAEMNGDFLELSFTPQRINALDTLFNS